MMPLEASQQDEIKDEVDYAVHIHFKAGRERLEATKGGVDVACLWLKLRNLPIQENDVFIRECVMAALQKYYGRLDDETLAVLEQMYGEKET